MVEQRNGRMNSGDVSLFYRAFGARGRTPILLMHGANYFDSYAPEIVGRISRDYPNIEWAPVDSRHDVAHQAPDARINAIRKFSAAA
jgi:hypothetical protein